MAPDSLVGLTAVELGELIRRREVSSEETVGSFLDRITALNPTLNAVITLERRSALEAARPRLPPCQSPRSAPLIVIFLVRERCFRSGRDPSKTQVAGSTGRGSEPSRVRPEPPVLIGGQGGGLVSRRGSVSWALARTEEARSAMAELAPEEVRRMAATIGLTIDDHDLADVAFRLNATFEMLRRLDELDVPGTLPEPYLDVAGAGDAGSVVRGGVDGA